jgi:hypothetical protein
VESSKQLEQNRRVGGHDPLLGGAPHPVVGAAAAGHLIAVPPHVASERLPHLEAEPADVALVLLLLRRRLVGLVLLERLGADDAEVESVGAAAEVAGAVPAERLERGEGAVAGLADEVALPGRGHQGAPPPPRPLRRRRPAGGGGGGGGRRRGVRGGGQG